MSQKFKLGYTVLDGNYQNGKLEVITGDDAGKDGNFGSLQSPLNLNADIPATLYDPAVFSYMNGTELRLVLAKRTTVIPGPSTCAYTIITPLVATEAADLVLQYPAGTNVATNPHGIAEVGDWLYIVDYDHQAIYQVGKTELDGAAGNKTLASAPVSLAAQLADLNAKGQAIIALKDASGSIFLFALFISNDDTGAGYSDSILVKMSVNAATGALAYVDKVTVGLNAQEIIPVNNAGTVTLLIPAIGGEQQEGATNGTYSNIVSVPAFTGFSQANTVIRLTGDTFTTWAAVTNADIRAIAAPSPDSANEDIYILTGTYTPQYAGVMWTLYHTKVTELMGVTNQTLSAAASSILTSEDKGASSSGNYWDVLYENGDAGNVDRLWFLRGSPIVVTRAADYSSADKVYPVGTGTGTIDGTNVNTAELLAETIRQAGVGISIKRGLRGAAAPVEEEKK